MVDKELVDYLRKGLKNGESPDSLKTILLRQGWREEDVNRALEFAKPKKKSSNKIIIIAVILIGIIALLIFLSPLLSWLYLSSEIESLTENIIDVSNVICAEGRDVTIFIMNTGDNEIKTSEIIIKDKEAPTKTLDVEWKTLNNNPLTKIGESESGKIIIRDCCTTDCPKTCSYEITIADKKWTATAYCPG